MSPSDIAGELNIPHFKDLIDTFFQHQLESQPFEHLDLDSNITIYTSAIAVFHAPSDICSIQGMAKEWIHMRPRWGKFRVPHYNTTYVVTNPNVSSMGGLNITRVKLFFFIQTPQQDLPLCTYSLVLKDWYTAQCEYWDVVGWAWLQCQRRCFVCGNPPWYPDSCSSLDWWVQLATIHFDYICFCSRYVWYILC